MLKNRKGAVLVGMGVLMILSLIFVNTHVTKAEQPLPKAVSIATHSKGSLLNVIGTGFAKVVSLHTKISAIDRPFAGYTAWIPLVNKSDVDMGISSASELYYAYKGMPPYKEEHKNLQILCSGNGMDLSYVVRANSGIKTIRDLRNKRVCIDMSSSTVKLINETILLAGGLDLKKDITVIPIAGVVEQLNALADGRADAVWAATGMGAVKETAAKVGGIIWLPVCQSADDSAANIIRKGLPGQDVRFWKAGSAPDEKNDTWLVDSVIVLSTYKTFSDEAAFLIVKAIWENEKELAAIHTKLRGWKEAMVKENVAQILPYHKGAIRFYKEVGVWPDKIDRIQKNLLPQ